MLSKVISVVSLFTDKYSLVSHVWLKNASNNESMSINLSNLLNLTTFN